MADVWIPSVLAAGSAVAVGVFARMAAAVAIGVLPLAIGVGFRVQAALVLAITIAACPTAAAVSQPMAVDAWGLVGIAVVEGLVGLVMGAAAAAIFASASWAGAVLGSVTGLSWADDFGGEAGSESAGMARLAWWMALAGFIGAGGHAAVVAGLIDSVHVLPIGAAVGVDGSWHDGLVALAGSMPGVGLSLAVSLALPALAAVLAFHLVAAICVRTAGFDPGQGLLQAAASLVLLVAVCAGTDSWIGGFAALVEPPLERCFHDIHP